MDSQIEHERPSQGQLISVPHKDTVRLLEVYIKRSLSLNDGNLGDKKAKRKEKWVTVPRKQRRHSSDPSLHFTEGRDDEGIDTFSAVETPSNPPETIEEEPEKHTKKSKKNKKPSFWKSLAGIFSRKSEEEDGPPEAPEVSQAEEPFDNKSAFLPSAPAGSQKKKSSRKKALRRRFSKRRLSLTKQNRSGKDLNYADITRVNGEFLGISTTTFCMMHEVTNNMTSGA